MKKTQPKTKKAKRHPVKIAMASKVVTVGYVQERVWHKKVKESIHFLRVPPAIAFDFMSVNNAKRYGAHTIHIIEEEAKRNYYARVEVLEKNGIRVQRGHGEQIALELSMWRSTQIESDRLFETLKLPKADPKQDELPITN